jgi:hypothetical protein
MTNKQRLACRFQLSREMIELAKDCSTFSELHFSVHLRDLLKALQGKMWNHITVTLETEASELLTLQQLQQELTDLTELPL